MRPDEPCNKLKAHPGKRGPEGRELGRHEDRSVRRGRSWRGDGFGRKSKVEFSIYAQNKERKVKGTKQSFCGNRRRAGLCRGGKIGKEELEVREEESGDSEKGLRGRRERGGKREGAALSAPPGGEREGKRRCAAVKSE